LRCPNKKKGEGAKSGEYGGWVECRAIRKKLSSQNTLVTFAGCGLALSACTTHLLSPLSTSNSDFGENISDIVGGREYLSVGMAWHGINNLEFMEIPDERSHQF
jgi:hypothetical protein